MKQEEYPHHVLSGYELILACKFDEHPDYDDPYGRAVKFFVDGRYAYDKARAEARRAGWIIETDEYGHETTAICPVCAKRLKEMLPVRSVASGDKPIVSAKVGTHPSKLMVLWKWYNLAKESKVLAMPFSTWKNTHSSYRRLKTCTIWQEYRVDLENTHEELLFLIR